MHHNFYCSIDNCRVLWCECKCHSLPEDPTEYRDIPGFPMYKINFEGRILYSEFEVPMAHLEIETDKTKYYTLLDPENVIRTRSMKSLVELVFPEIFK